LAQWLHRTLNKAFITSTNFDAIFDLKFSGGSLVVVKPFEKLNIVDIDAHVNEVLVVRGAARAIEEVIDPLDLKEVKGVLVLPLQAFIH
jgi:hypothetical protein